ncbi:39S ribosomal protein L23, mitochondrial isoform X3 [Fukomys damarensis]|uniref:39S ribosomal protein L23, mitochondrial isoform X3 n=1 Tax=Fukomys damarensis TaxID=885580 RepID=UPI001455A11E|nr:39S ribosomal protein L23, mitochondrial isoform X3 [Fukomys damarensis]
MQWEYVGSLGGHSWLGPVSIPCTSWAAPSSEYFEPTSSSSWYVLEWPSLKTQCSSGSPWSSNRQRDHRNVRIKKPDYKVAYVQLAHGQTFTFPDLFPETEPSPSDKEQSEFLEDVKQRQSRDPRRGGVSDWFGL